ncbi:metal-dependent hydrolase [Aliidongia dinghuensis]|uniref:Metal-dependent hydrolase n=1 Tax=Aliidongia dinghuensis TaxID=1867774 RepID=A0A8J3E396_9PROT|nr:MBL fold metallo-hydrolase [Aliidongia dinghuensis]GGF14507.1 metal-dependent hydrolase [Aliidongia dinghuensis]
MSRLRVTILGCGGSQGVPTPVGDWGLCDPKNPRNRRLRPSILVEATDAEGGRKTILVDAGPDLRAQLLAVECRHIDALLFTHSHADHTHGIDDLRAVNRLMGRPIPFWAAPETLADIRQRFGYAVVDDPAVSNFYRPVLVAHEMDGPFVAAGIPVVPFEQDHGFSRSWGFRIGNFAYSTDVVQLNEAAFEALAGIELWVVDCLREAPHPTHSHLERTLDWIDRLKPRRAIFTHMDQSSDFDVIRRQLPPGVEPGYDGLVAEL